MKLNHILSTQGLALCLYPKLTEPQNLVFGALYQTFGYLTRSVFFLTDMINRVYLCYAQ